MVKNNGFTMVEACISMLIVAVFLSAAMNIFTKKYQKPVYNTAHGSFLCYNDGAGNIYQRSSGESAVKVDSYCSFKQVRSAEYYVINAVGGGGGGSSSYGGNAGEYRSFFLPSLYDEIRIVPGKGGARNYDGEPTLIKDSSNEVLMTAAGGLAGITSSYITTKDIKSCSAVIGSVNNSILKTCSDFNATCVVNDDMVVVNSCDTKESKSVSRINLSNIKGTTAVFNTTNFIVTLNLSNDIAAKNKTADAQSSGFESYLRAADLDTNNADVLYKGRGGAKRTAGDAGAVLIIW
jgi:Tfp pilus assembly protein PilE